MNRKNGTMDRQQVNGLLLLYNFPLNGNAGTILEYVNAFPRHSRFQVWPLNTELGFPPALEGLEFAGIVMHYSLFGIHPYKLDASFLRYLEASRSSYKVAIFQDEYRYCRERFTFVDRYAVDCVYSLIFPQNFKDFYGKYTRVPKVINAMTGYVGEETLEAARRFTIPDEKRTIDIGYRARSIPYYVGKGTREKVTIAWDFLARAGDTGLVLDIKVDDNSRLYGDDWYRFLANCRGVLGVESGVSYNDVEDKARPAVEKLVAENPGISFEEVFDRVLFRYEGNIPNRLISPRHFEAAALRICQVLFEGEYSGVMQAGEHYIPLKKDFSNFNEVIRRFKDPAERARLTANAWEHMVASGNYSYQKFITRFDEVLLEAGLKPGIDSAVFKAVGEKLGSGLALRQGRASMQAFFDRLRPTHPAYKAVTRRLRSLGRKVQK